MPKGGNPYQKGYSPHIRSKDIGFKAEPTRSFNWERVEDYLNLSWMKRDKRDFFFYDEKFVSGYKCTSKTQLHLLEVEEDVVIIIDDVP